MSDARPVVMITGAARGIGAALARALAQGGSRLALAGLEADALATLTAELGPEHLWFEADVRDQAALDDAVRATIRTFGRLDACVANAGIANFGTVTKGDPDAWARCIDVNLTGTMRTAHAAMPALIESRGYLLIVCSLASFAATPGLSAYCASKAGAEQLAIALRREVNFRGVAVGTAHPAWVETDLVRDAEADLPAFKTMRRQLAWPAGTTVTQQACAEALARGIERRSRRIYVPRYLAVLNWGRTLINGPLGDHSMRKQSIELIPALEQDIEGLGRSFSERTNSLTT